LSNIVPRLQLPEACKMYAGELLHRLQQYQDVSKDAAALEALQSRWKYHGDRMQFEKALHSGEITDAQRIRPAYDALALREQGDRPGIRPVNIRWFERLPKDLNEFLRNYRATG